LLERNHRCFAHISGPLKLRLARERQRGFREALEDSGVSAKICASKVGDWGCESGYQAMRQLLENDPVPTAVFVANDRMAIGAIRAIFEARMSVPDDISIIGLDDLEVAAYQVPPLTTVRQSFAEIATLAVRLLLEILEGKEPEESQIVIEPVLIERQSTAPPPG
jgi:DNA-binding LacI/PurR family transcriptional regulator